MDVAKIAELAKQVGIDQDLFAEWDGGALALYPIAGARSASVEAARRQVRDNDARGEWALDLGHRAVRLSATQGEALRKKLEQEGVEFENGSLADAYMKRADRVAAIHDEVLSELAKR